MKLQRNQSARNISKDMTYVSHRASKSKVANIIALLNLQD